MRTFILASLLILLPAIVPITAEASCMCFMRPEPESSLGDEGVAKNPATAVFLLRDGTRTILTVEPTYDGPVTDVSMIVPIPHAIERSDIRTISGHHFRRVDAMTAPHAHHVWPDCAQLGAGRLARQRRASAGGFSGAVGEPSELGVEVIEEWDVDEYDVSLLSASQSSGLLTFLRERGLELPDRADEVLRSYIETDHRFALVEVDLSEAHEVGGRLVLSPIQLQYESEELRVPVRLGTLNSPGEQELLLYVLSREGRFEIANRENIVAPTGTRLRGDYEGGFAPFYEGLMERIFDAHEGAAVTEFAQPLLYGRASVRAVWYLGMDRYRTDPNPYAAIGWRDAQRWTLTRIRHRYGTELDDDLVLRVAEPLREDSAVARLWRAQRNHDANAFDVRFRVQHRTEDPNQCPEWRTRERLARQWAATSGRMWESERSVWPGSVILDPVLGIEPGSSPPPEPVEPEAPEEVDAPEETVEAAESAPASPPTGSTGICATRTGRSSAGAIVGLFAIAWLVRRRRAR